MARVAENQDRAQQARAAWVYDQNVFVRLKRGKKLAREESRDYVVTPRPEGTHKELKRLSGKVDRKGKILEFSDPKEVEKGFDIDADLAEEFAGDFAGSKDGKDGVDPGLFPLTADKQQNYAFELHGREQYRGSEVYKVTFEPKKGTEDEMWRGEALIDVNDYQPVLVTTTLAWGIPAVIRTVFGTNLKHLGFKISYQKVADGVWFPAKWGGEFHLRALFLYARTISLAVSNTEFRRATVNSTITFEKPPE